MGNEVNEKFTKIIANMVMTHIRVIYNKKQCTVFKAHRI